MRLGAALRCSRCALTSRCRDFLQFRGSFSSLPSTPLTHQPHPHRNHHITTKSIAIRFPSSNQQSHRLPLSAIWEYFDPAHSALSLLRRLNPTPILPVSRSISLDSHRDPSLPASHVSRYARHSSRHPSLSHSPSLINSQSIYSNQSSPLSPSPCRPKHRRPSLGLDNTEDPPTAAASKVWAVLCPPP